jgi:hypothetical protein
MDNHKYNFPKQRNTFSPPERPALLAARVTYLPTLADATISEGIRDGIPVAVRVIHPYSPRDQTLIRVNATPVDIPLRSMPTRTSQSFHYSPLWEDGAPSLSNRSMYSTHTFLHL